MGRSLARSLHECQNGWTNGAHIPRSTDGQCRYCRRNERASGLHGDVARDWNISPKPDGGLLELEDEENWRVGEWVESGEAFDLPLSV